MTTLLIEPFGGLAGDMFLAALCDLRDPRFGIEELERLVRGLDVGDVALELRETRRRGLRALELDVRPGEADPPHRHLSDVIGLVERAPLSDAARARAAGVFRRIARAEARVHGVSEQEVHFHEVGAVDSLVDVCGAVLAIENLGATRVVSTPPLVGDGTVRCEHGELPVPAPATAELLRGVDVRLGGGGERLTPTAAALLVELAVFEPAGGFVARSIGYGAGRRDPESGPPNLARVQLGDAPAGGAAERRTVLEFEFHVDDSTGEELGYCVEKLRAAGVLDAWQVPVFMKKGRPGVLCGGLVVPDLRAEVERIAFDQSSTLGVRWSERSRTECRREELVVDVDGVAVRVKRRLRPHAPDAIGAADLSPEYEDLRRLAEASGAPLRELAQRAVRAALIALGDERSAGRD